MCLPYVCGCCPFPDCTWAHPSELDNAFAKYMAVLEAKRTNKKKELFKPQTYKIF